MNGAALVQLALNALSCTQKELAVRLGVSPTQISKWKSGEHMSKDMDDKLRKMSGIGDKDPQFVVWAGSLDAADKWEKVIRLLADAAQEEAETGYVTEPLTDDMGLLPWHTFHVLRKMGVELPKEFPKEVEGAIGLNEEDDSASDLDSRWEAMMENPYTSLIYKIYKSLNDVYGFYAAYVEGLVYDESLDIFEIGSQVDSCLLELAAAKLDEKPVMAANYDAFKWNTLQDYEKWLNTVKEKAFRAGVPLRAELLDLAYGSAGELGSEAEAESLGLNKGRLHPDIYMNELLVGMRTIHQVLPAILKKLGISEEFKLDASEFRVNSRR
ncbi:helix-turn-helix transcriptional regulator [Telmatospirillum sp. J64-1]|uniref:helix-turn-helix domain-containing protein n=1 Tax=Telmatospirillum sp. J64-1 TaxID=2502183 RepID=UPI00115E8415|nr:helix-turn-helix transcriptional regulator [Telmatospirillum sp. J64-1]